MANESTKQKSVQMAQHNKRTWYIHKKFSVVIFTNMEDFSWKMGHVPLDSVVCIGWELLTSLLSLAETISKELRLFAIVDSIVKAFLSAKRYMDIQWTHIQYTS